MFIICNQHQQILEKSGNWQYGEENRSVYRTQHKDEAINQIVELTVKNPDLRAKITAVDVNEKGLLILPDAPEAHPQTSAADDTARPCSDDAIDNIDDKIATTEEQPLETTANPEKQPTPSPQQVLV